MAETLGNNGSALKRADIYYNDNGVIKTIDDMEVCHYNNGAWYMFPQKDDCLVNLDFVSFSDNSLDGANTHLTRNFELWQSGTQQTTLGNIVSTNPSGQTGYRINPTEKYWFVNNVGKTNIVFNEDVFANSQMTLSITCKFVGNPSNWRDLWIFENTDQLRCEWNGSSLIIYGENSLIPGSPLYPRIDRTQLFNITFVLNGRDVTGYQNGQQVFTSTLSRDILQNMVKLYLCSQRGGGTGSFGTGVYFYDLALWKTALTEQEVSDYLKFIYFN